MLVVAHVLFTVQGLSMLSIWEQRMEFECFIFVLFALGDEESAFLILFLNFIFLIRIDGLSLFQARCIPSNIVKIAATHSWLEFLVSILYFDLYIHLSLIHI